MRLTHHPQPAQMPRASEGTERGYRASAVATPSEGTEPATPQPPRVALASSDAATAPSRLVLCAVCSRPNCGAPHIFGRSNTRRSRADLVTATRGYRASAVAASSRQQLRRSKKQGSGVLRSESAGVLPHQAPKEHSWRRFLHSTIHTLPQARRLFPI